MVDHSPLCFSFEPEVFLGPRVGMVLDYGHARE